MDTESNLEVIDLKQASCDHPINQSKYRFTKLFDKTKIVLESLEL